MKTETNDSKRNILGEPLPTVNCLLPTDLL